MNKNKTFEYATIGVVALFLIVTIVSFTTTPSTEFGKSMLAATDQKDSPLNYSLDTNPNNPSDPCNDLGGSKKGLPQLVPVENCNGEPVSTHLENTSIHGPLSGVHDVSSLEHREPSFSHVTNSDFHRNDSNTHLLPSDTHYTDSGHHYSVSNFHASNSVTHDPASKNHYENTVNHSFTTNNHSPNSSNHFYQPPVTYNSTTVLIDEPVNYEPSIVQTSPNKSLDITRNLSLNTTGPEVQLLQEKLKTAGFFKGESTTYFGPLTLQAVISFQTKYNIQPASGFVGPLTRAYLNNLDLINR